MQISNVMRMTIAQLRMRLTTRGCSISELAPHQYADRCRGLWKEWKEEFEAIRTEEVVEKFREVRTTMYSRTRQMFRSFHELDPTRKSFLDLAGEVLNMVYQFALFEEPADDYASTED